MIRKCTWLVILTVFSENEGLLKVKKVTYTVKVVIHVSQKRCRIDVLTTDH